MIQERFDLINKILINKGYTLVLEAMELRKFEWAKGESKATLLFSHSGGQMKLIQS